MAAPPSHAGAIEPPELAARSLWVAARLWAAGQAFFFLAFLFAFFYLRALNSDGQWRSADPKHVPHPSLAFGIAILVCILASAGVLWIVRHEELARWRLGATASLLLGLAAIALQCAEFTSLNFGTTDGGYASVFLGWSGLYALFAFCSMYWLTSLITGSRRLSSSDIVTASGADAFRFVWSVLATIEVAAFILLYVVA